MNVEELQTDIEYLEQQYLNAGQSKSHEMRAVLEAARLVANPNIEAAKAEGDRQLAIPEVVWLDYHKIVDAALTPQEDTE